MGTCNLNGPETVHRDSWDIGGPDRFKGTTVFRGVWQQIGPDLARTPTCSRPRACGRLPWARATRAKMVWARRATRWSEVKRATQKGRRRNISSAVEEASTALSATATKALRRSQPVTWGRFALSVWKKKKRVKNMFSPPPMGCCRVGPNNLGGQLHDAMLTPAG